MLGYLSYYSRGKTGLINNGGDPHTMPSRWLNVLRLVHQGVLAEFETVSAFIRATAISCALSKHRLRQAVFERFVNVTASVDLRYMRELALNMVNGGMKHAQAAGAAKVQMGEDSSEEDALYDTLRSFQLSCIDVFLSEEIVDQRMVAFEEECASQGKELVIRKRNPLVQANIDEQEKERRKRELKSLMPRTLGADETPTNPDRELETEMLGESILQPRSRKRDEY